MKLAIFLLFVLTDCIFSTTKNYHNIFNHACETNFNCTQVLANSICYNKRCICLHGFKSDGCLSETNSIRYRRNIDNEQSSVRPLGEECQWTEECRVSIMDASKVCLDNICQCSTGHVPIDAYRCIRVFETSTRRLKTTKTYEKQTIGHGSKCLTTTDCEYSAVNLECINGVCVCLEGYVPLGKYLCYSMNGQNTSIAEDPIVLSPRTTTTDSTTTTTTRQPIDNQVIKSLGKIGNTCTNDYFCRRSVPEAHCYNGKCQCINGYIAVDLYTCVKYIVEETTKTTPMPADYKSLLGGKCATKRNCHTQNAVCIDSICSCPADFFPVDDWTCLEDTGSFDEEFTEATSIITTTAETTTTTMVTTTTVFRWWPWSPTPAIRHTYPYIKNAFRVRCLLNRQCASMDKNSHCTLFGRCVCNQDYELETTDKGQRCVSRVINEDDCN